MLQWETLREVVRLLVLTPQSIRLFSFVFVLVKHMVYVRIMLLLNWLFSLYYEQLQADLVCDGRVEPQIPLPILGTHQEYMLISDKLEY
jgi:hypothetical protein